MSLNQLSGEETCAGANERTTTYQINYFFMVLMLFLVYLSSEIMIAGKSFICIKSGINSNTYSKLLHLCVYVCSSTKVFSPNAHNKTSNGEYFATS